MSDHKPPAPTKWHEGNRFYLLDTFNDEMQEGIVGPLTKKIDELSKVKDAEIELWINSHGGDGGLCLHLCELVELAKAKGIVVKTIITYAAYSAGSILAVTGTVGHRYIARNAEHLIHYGSFDGYRKHTPLQIDRHSAHYKRWVRTIRQHYERYAKVPKLEEHMKDDDFWISASNCIKWKLADKYMDEL